MAGPQSAPCLAAGRPRCCQRARDCRPERRAVLRLAMLGLAALETQSVLETLLAFRRQADIADGLFSADPELSRARRSSYLGSRAVARRQRPHPRADVVVQARSWLSRRSTPMRALSPPRPIRQRRRVEGGAGSGHGTKSRLRLRDARNRCYPPAPRRMEAPYATPTRRSLAPCTERAARCNLETAPSGKARPIRGVPPAARLGKGVEAALRVQFHRVDCERRIDQSHRPESVHPEAVRPWPGPHDLAVLPLIA